MSNREIYNQGRVVGYSSYEIYVKQHMSENPDVPPATEREWLASSIGSGSSLLVKLDSSCRQTYESLGSYIMAKTGLGQLLVEDYETFRSTSMSISADTKYIMYNYYDIASYTLGSAAKGYRTILSKDIKQTTYIDYDGAQEYGPLIEPEPGDSALWVTFTSKSPDSIPTLWEATLTADYYIYEISLPENSQLFAPSTITANVFLGDAEFEGHFATKITSYGPLISNTETLHPTDNDVPPSHTYLTQEQAWQLHEYCKLIDGAMITPKTWTKSESQTPYCDLQSELTSPNSTQKIRILADSELKHPIYLLLSGFSLSSIVLGTAGTDGSTAVTNPENGTFLGPAVIPWASKILFCISTSLINTLVRGQYSRVLDNKSATVTSWPIIDMESTDPGEYYLSHDSESRVSLIGTTARVIGDSASVLSVYSKQAELPPALYGTKVPNYESMADWIRPTGKLNPIDTVAPGTVKLYHGDDGSKSRQLESAYHKNYGFHRDADSYVIRQLNQYGQSVPVAETYTDTPYGQLYSSEPIPPYFCLQRDNVAPPEVVTFTTTLLRRISGCLSNKFYEDCGIEFEPDDNDSTKPKQGTLLGDIYYARYQGLADGSSDRRYAQQIDTTLCKDIWSVGKGQDYYYVLQGPSSNPFETPWLNLWTVIPVSKDSNAIDYIERDTNFPDIRLPWYRDMPLLSTHSDFDKYLGTSGGEMNEDKTRSNPLYWGKHQKLKDYLHTSSGSLKFIQASFRRIPATTDADGKSIDWVKEYQDTLLSEVFIEGQLGTEDVSTGTNKGYSIEYNDNYVINYTYVHPDFRGLSLYDFLEKAKTHDVSTGVARDLKLNKYFAHKDSISISNNKQDEEHDMCKLSVTESVDLSITLNQSNAAQAIKIPIPDGYTSESGARTCVVQTGNHKTRSLSMDDENNTPYILQGSAGSIEAKAADARRVLNWDMLTEALQNNKSIELLSTLLQQLSDSLDSAADGSYSIQISTTGDKKTINLKKN